MAAGSVTRLLKFKLYRAEQLNAAADALVSVADELVQSPPVDREPKAVYLSDIPVEWDARLKVNPVKIASKQSWDALFQSSASGPQSPTASWLLQIFQGWPCTLDAVLHALKPFRT